MTDTWQHAGGAAILSLETARKARLAELAAQADVLRQCAETNTNELRKVMEEMNRISETYAAEYVELVKRERRHAR